MKYLNKIIALFLSFLLTNNVYAEVGDFGFFGGISEGRNLPKTTEQLLKKNSNSNTKLQTNYKEIIFLSGKPQEFVGTLITTNKGSTTADSGTYKVSYKVTSNGETSDNVKVDRNIEYNINYRREATQIIKDYDFSKWTEKITIGDTTYTLDDDVSKSTISIIEDETPGVNYYKGNISHKAVYTSNSGNVTYEISGTIYGYSSAWSSTETQRLDCTVSTDNWQIHYQIRPSVSVGKTLQYSENEPTAISFSGNYREVMQNKSGANYTVLTKPVTYTSATSGNLSLATYNTFEQLIAPNVTSLRGHFAESDIKKLFSMQVLDGDANYYKPNQAITRGEYIKMLVKSIKLPITEVDQTKKGTSYDIVFSDVLPTRSEYPYVMAAYESGITEGKSNGMFGIDDPIERQEAIVMLVRTLGLENLGVTNVPLTSFVDDAKIANWAKKEVYAANRLGIISGDEDGKFNPKSYLSKAEAAAIVNRLIDYMRVDLQTDYTENIINYIN